MQQKDRFECPDCAGTRVPAFATQLSAVLREHTRLRHDAAGCRPLEPLQRRFEIIAQTTPCATAVRCNGRHLTYGELDAQADELALHLQQGGLVPGSFCVVGLEPSLAQVRAILAVLKAGAVCLQFDPALPRLSRAVVFAAFRPSILFARDCGCEPGSDMRMIRCGEEADDLPHGWPDELPVDAHTPAHAIAAVSDDGSLCISVRTHQALCACLDTENGIGPPRAAAPDPARLWRPLSNGAQLTIEARA
jgi:non-ribosomal peptide synthetase component F